MSAAQLGFSFDVGRCSGCMACVVACSDQNDLPEDGWKFRQVNKVETGLSPAVDIGFVSLSCMHCGEAPCVAVCPRGALSKREADGIVTVNRDECIGCHACATACPIGAPQFADGARMGKCDLCLARVTSGLEPACVRTCPTRALGFGPMEELAGRKSGTTVTAFPPWLRPSLLVVRSLEDRSIGGR